MRGSKAVLKKNLNELNTRNPSIEISKEGFHFWIPRYTLRTTNYIPKYLERKQTGKSFLTSTQSIQSH